MVVSRLLHKNLSQHESTPPFLDDLQSQLVSLRQNLLKRIDKRLASSGASEESVIESLAAYCLVTQSSSDDAIHHFHQVRLDIVVSQVDLSRENIPKALRLFIRTLQISKTLRSRQFSDVLSKLKARPILSDPEIRGLDGLEIEVLGRWAAPDVNNFIPWIKLSECGRAEGLKFIKDWSQQAFERLAEGCQKSLGRSDEISELLSLRAETLELWLTSWGSTITHSHVAVLKELRHLFNEHLKRVLVAQVQTIDEVAGHVVSAIADWENAEHNALGCIWDADLTSADFSNGAGAFKQIVADRLLGRDDDVSAVLKKYQSWLASVQQLNESIDSLRRLKWTDILVGGDEADDEDVDITPLLNEDDPTILSDAFHSAVRQAFGTLQASFKDAFKSFGTSHQSQKATFLLRLIRFVRRDIPPGFVAETFTFSSEVVPELQELLASEIVGQCTLSLVSASKFHAETGATRIVPGRSLWEGEPGIPVQPSPGTFKFLRRLTAAMDKSGSDLWDPSTVRVLKTALQKKLETAIGSTLDELETWSASSKDAAKSEAEDDQSSSNGIKDEQNASATEESSKPEQHSHAEVLRDWKTQLLFDAIYLANMLGDPSHLAQVIDRVQKSAEPSNEAMKGLRISAEDYWKRTTLLFGLLAER